MSGVKETLSSIRRVEKVDQGVIPVGPVRLGLIENLEAENMVLEIFA